MCHSSPTAQILGALVALVGTIFVAWHIWCFDRGRCLIFRRQDAFRWLIMWMLLVSLSLFLTWNFVLTYVKYSEYYAVIPVSATETKIVPVPFQLWSKSQQALVRAGYHVLSIAWGLLLCIHTEETLYWAYLIGAIRSRNAKLWFSSIYFKIWLMCVVTVFGVLLGAAQIETEVLTKMEGNIFLAGSIFAVLIMFTSLWLVAVFPGFIRESRRQGANPEVIGRLQYFQELNVVRTVFRAIYATALLTLSVDGFTKHAWLNTTPFWLDALYIIGFFSVFTSTAISLLILLPRSMSSEAGITRQQANVFIRQAPNSTYNQPNHPYKHQSSKSYLNSPTSKSVLPSNRDIAPTTSPWGVLGERLNLEKEIVEDLDDGLGNFNANGSASELYDLPFAAQPGSRRLDEDEIEAGFSSAPRALNNFRSPLDVQPQGPVDLNIVVMTSTVVEQDSS